MEEQPAIPKRARQIAGVLLAANALVAIIALPAGLYFGVVALFQTPDDAGDSFKPGFWVSAFVGAVVLGAVLLGLVLLVGYGHMACGLRPRWGPRRFWEVSAVYNALLAVAYTMLPTSEPLGVAWTVSICVLSVVARAMVIRAPAPPT